MTITKTPTAKSGFTLIELSIVLVIIGLIVGGVLVGQDLIKAAEVRATVSQIEKFDAAANTFRAKYNSLPGDIASATNFGLTSTTGDGDGILDRATDNTTAYDNEAPAFLKHLAEASLIADQVAFTSTIAANIDSLSDASVAAKVGAGSRIIAYGATGLNYYMLVAGGAVTNGVITFTASSEMPVITAYQLDTKLDDGNPTTGRMTAVTDMTTADGGNAGSADNHCVDTTGNDLYQIATTARANDTECTLRVRSSF